MELKSQAFEDQGAMPDKFAKDGQNVSPPLDWSDVPEGTKAFALMVEDPDASNGSWVHWLLYDLPEDMRQLPEAVAPVSIVFGTAKQGKNDYGKFGYGGPAPPPPAEHRYVFELLALDQSTGLEPGATLQAIKKATDGHVLEMAQLVGKYRK